MTSYLLKDKFQTSRGRRAQSSSIKGHCKHEEAEDLSLNSVHIWRRIRDSLS
ncbi:hypothetical protein KIN20_017057 [Parelaphostrongylus tenuis]|uniref:Uncharacterized protein n=1 Tax=Parelaphostrongylus tenuis TaxID=148309 RepID=A0AAD5QNE2_PARTN|nr:hypothetical protein KIN20_017057 [Parelaphostrongylus tenuis]